MFMSPHVNPIVSLGGLIYVANTPADTIDIIEADTREVVLRIKVGIDPVGTEPVRELLGARSGAAPGQASSAISSRSGSR